MYIFILYLRKYIILPVSTLIFLKVNTYIHTCTYIHTYVHTYTKILYVVAVLRRCSVKKYLYTYSLVHTYIHTCMHTNIQESSYRIGGIVLIHLVENTGTHEVSLFESRSDFHSYWTHTYIQTLIKNKDRYL